MATTITDTVTPASAPLAAHRVTVAAQPGFRRRNLIIGGIAMLAVAGGLWWYLSAQGADAPAYRFATVARGDLRSTVAATGTLSAVKTVMIGTQVSGQVSEIHADFNDHVTKGELLARIDPTLQRQAVADAKASLDRANAQLLQARQEFDRNQPLYAQQDITGSEFNTIELNLAVAQSGATSAQIALDKAEQNLSLTNIYSPINGVVVERDIDVGQTVAASLSAPQLFLLAQDLGQMQILAPVDESDIGSIKEGQLATFTVQTYPGRTFTGTVSQVRLQSTTTDNVVSYNVVVSLPNPDQKLLPGMTATVAFITGSATDVLLVPNAALRFNPSAALLAATGTTAAARPSGDSAPGATRTRTRAAAAPGTGVGLVGSLWVLDAGKRPKRLRVRTGLADGQRTEISGDSVSVGMQVITSATLEGSTATSAVPTTNPLTPTRTGRGGGPP